MQRRLGEPVAAGILRDIMGKPQLLGAVVYHWPRRETSRKANLTGPADAPCRIHLHRISRALPFAPLFPNLTAPIECCLLGSIQTDPRPGLWEAPPPMGPNPQAHRIIQAAIQYSPFKETSLRQTLGYLDVPGVSICAIPP